MREIKFRAWNKKHNRWVHVGTHAQDGIVTIRPVDSYTEVMQYTGLKDKNGVEVYEGDLVSCGTLDGAPVGQVVFIEDNGQFEVCNRDTRLEHFTIWHTVHMEVIGNIYENGDLLK